MHFLRNKKSSVEFSFVPLWNAKTLNRNPASDELVFITFNYFFFLQCIDVNGVGFISILKFWIFFDLCSVWDLCSRICTVVIFRDGLNLNCPVLHGCKTTWHHRTVISMFCIMHYWPIVLSYPHQKGSVFFHLPHLLVYLLVGYTVGKYYKPAFHYNFM